MRKAIALDLSKQAMREGRGEYWLEQACKLSLVYRVPTEEAVLAVDSWFEACDTFWTKKILCDDDYTHLLTVIFASNPKGLLQSVLASPGEVAKMQRQPANYFEQLHRNFERKGGGPKAYDALSLYKKVALGAWGYTNPCRPAVPPMCLWTDEAILEVYDATQTLTPDAVRQAINRELKLYRPPSARYAIERRGMNFLRFVRRGEKG